MNQCQRSPFFFIFFYFFPIENFLTGETKLPREWKRFCKERNCCYLPESSWGSGSHRGFRTVWPALCTVGYQTPSSAKPKQITLTVTGMLSPTQLRGIQKLFLGNSLAMKCQGLDMKMQCDETVSINIDFFFKMVTEAHIPLKLHAGTALTDSLLMRLGTSLEKYN